VRIGSGIVPGCASQWLARDLLENDMRILSGIQPSGKLHLGNYFGMMKPALLLQERGEAFLFIANYHALTSVSDPARLRADTLDVALDFLACGLDPTCTTFFRQSDVPAVTELTWLLSVVTPMGLLERCHSYKDKLARGIPPSHALFSYPVLMAADILIYQSNIVPVGRDQKQHVEVTRDIAIKFNSQFGPVFTIPEPSIQEDVAVVPGLDGQKMSKSYGNTIDLFGDLKEIKSRIMRIVTDSKELAEPKDPSTCSIFALYRLFASPAERDAMAERYRAGNFGYGTAKKALFEAFEAFFAPMRRRRAELAGNLDYVDSVLRQGAERARAEADKTLRAARQAVGL
jgi:tryptophanyl-tRNA synthetase